MNPTVLRWECIVCEQEVTQTPCPSCGGNADDVVVVWSDGELTDVYADAGTEVVADG